MSTLDLEPIVEHAAKTNWERHRKASIAAGIHMPRWEDANDYAQTREREESEAYITAAAPLIEAAVREHDRNLLIRVLFAHQKKTRTDGDGIAGRCVCGWGRPGDTFPAHIADKLDAAIVRTVPARGETGDGQRDPICGDPYHRHTGPCKNWAPIPTTTSRERATPSTVGTSEEN